jgi:hypothetical protein
VLVKELTPGGRERQREMSKTNQGEFNRFFNTLLPPNMPFFQPRSIELSDNSNIFS